MRRMTHSGDFNGDLADGDPRYRDAVSGPKLVATPFRIWTTRHSQYGDAQGIPELLGLDGVAAVHGERAISLQAVRQAHKDPDEDDGEPAGETVVALEEAETRCQLISFRVFMRRMYVLVVVLTDPRGSCQRNDDRDDDGDNTPCEDDRRCMLLDVVLEGAHGDVDEPDDTSSGAARVDTTDVLYEARQEDAHGERRPLRERKSALVTERKDCLEHAHLREHLHRRPEDEIPEKELVTARDSRSKVTKSNCDAVVFSVGELATCSEDYADHV